MKKHFSGRSGENICGKLVGEFFLIRINKLSDKWQEVIQNNDEYQVKLFHCEIILE